MLRLLWIILVLSLKGLEQLLGFGAGIAIRSEITFIASQQEPALTSLCVNHHRQQLIGVPADDMALLYALVTFAHASQGVDDGIRSADARHRDG